MLVSRLPLDWLFNHQLKAIKVLEARFKLLDGMCLADDMGLGKTLTALALFMYFLKCKKIMIVCPVINI
jgi:SNF2 family DNA or RNA helicase